jgi:hypothetical protein
VWVEQAIFTSLTRQGKAGYHVVARSPGVTDAEASALATWSPSHGALVVDDSNRSSANFFPLPGGRYALSRTREGMAEYSGRGGRQLYTHALIFDSSALKRAGQPIALYRDALALGRFHYQPEPPSTLKPVELSLLHRRLSESAWADRAIELGLPPLDRLQEQVATGQSVTFAHDGDRVALVECLLGMLPPELIPSISFATSLQPSAVRPYRLLLVSPSAA